MAKTVAPLVSHPVSYLAKQLGVSRQRASRLLNDGRILGATKGPDGRWSVPVLPDITAGRRGPGPGPSTRRFYEPRPYRLRASAGLRSHVTPQSGTADGTAQFDQARLLDGLVTRQASLTREKNGPANDPHGEAV